MALKKVITSEKRLHCLSMSEGDKKKALTMTNGNKTYAMDCVPQGFIAPMTTVVLTALPFHFLMLKILLKDMRLSVPRHMIMLSLSLSDGIQLIVLFASMLTSIIFNFNVEENACFITRRVISFTGLLTICVSSCTIAMLSVERYIACIHSFRLHQIMEERRVLIGIILIWVTGAICAVPTAFDKQSFVSQTTFENDEISKTIISTVVVISSAVILTVQIRLFLFSRTKVSRVRPTQAFGCQAELADYRKKQMKIAFVAAIVAIGYLVCMLPLSAVFIHELLYHTETPLSTKEKIAALANLNTLANPIIYGLGVKDTRRLVLKSIKNKLSFLMCCNNKLFPKV